MRILALLQIYFMVLDVQAVNQLPPPENVTLLSNNFNHILIWSPGRDSPPGTLYRVSVSYKEGQRKKNIEKETKETTINISKYMLDIYEQYTVNLSALFGKRSSSRIRIPVTPFMYTTIGPPAVTVSGCGNCFNISVSLPVREGLRNHEEFYTGIKFNVHLRKAGEVKVFTHVCEVPKKLTPSLMLLKCFVGNLQPGGNYCVQAQPLLINEKIQVSDWVCAFTSSVEERGVAFVAGWTAGSLLMGMGLLVITASLVYTRSICSSRMDLPKALTDVVPGRYFSPEETQLSVAEADTSVKSHKPKQVQQTQADQHKQETDRDEEEEEDDDEDNSDLNRVNRNCNYMDRGMSDSDSQATNSGQSSTSTATTSCEVAENSGNCSAEFSPTEAEQSPSSSTAQSHLLNQHLTGNTQVTSAVLRPEKPNLLTLRETGPDEGQINGTEADFSQNINLSSVRLMSLETGEGGASHAKDVNQPLLPPLRCEPEEERLDLSKQQTGKPTLLGLHTHFYFQRNAQEDIRNEKLPKQKDLPETGSDQPTKHARTQNGYMSTHMGKLDTETDCLLEENEEEKEEEEEEEEDDDGDYSSGYMKR